MNPPGRLWAPSSKPYNSQNDQQDKTGETPWLSK
jgi:hypothetical protein